MGFLLAARSAPSHRRQTALMPVTKLESSEARKSNRLGDFFRLTDTAHRNCPVTNWSLTSFGTPTNTPGVNGAGADRISPESCEAFKSTVHVRAKERIAALLAL